MKYSLDRRGYNFQIRPDFVLGEFASPDSSAVIIQPSILDVAQRLRDDAGAPVVVNSAYRTASHNEAVGGVKNSAHLTGHAIDVDVIGETSEAVALWAERQPEVTGVGRYNTFCHIDTKKGKSRRWSERTTSVSANRASSTLLGNSPAPSRGRAVIAGLIERLRALDPVHLSAGGAGVVGLVLLLEDDAIRL